MTRKTKPTAHRDAGYSLIEIVIAVTLTGVVIVPLMAAVQAGIKASSVSRAAAQAETAVVNAADRINRAPLSCKYTTYAEASVQVENWPASAATVVHEWYDRDANAGAGGWVLEPTDPDACPLDQPTSDVVQRLTITIEPPNTNLRRSIQVVKTNV